MDTGIEQIKENPIKEITTYTDSRDILAKARQQADERNFDDIFIADIDAHHTETESWREIIAYIDDPVVRAQAEEMVLHRSGTPPYGLNGDLALRYQDVAFPTRRRAAKRSTRARSRKQVTVTSSSPSAPMKRWASTSRLSSPPRCCFSGCIPSSAWKPFWARPTTGGRSKTS